eukprot:TRINITY_DN34960_c0_g1_i1.p1 TRINITY_DN34960_c0_g1~~TRINITY_DN34960_c0_g1_i1.p1  ORF type:complete len:672 (-),score=85.33 TRINITY_DN34960_c0_g1_i1:49-2064(-)
MYVGRVWCCLCLFVLDVISSPSYRPPSKCGHDVGGEPLGPFSDGFCAIPDEDSEAICVQSVSTEYCNAIENTPTCFSNVGQPQCLDMWSYAMFVDEVGDSGCMQPKREAIDLEIVCLMYRRMEGDGRRLAVAASCVACDEKYMSNLTLVKDTEQKSNDDEFDENGLDVKGPIQSFEFLRVTAFNGRPGTATTWPVDVANTIKYAFPRTVMLWARTSCTDLSCDNLPLFMFGSEEPGENSLFGLSIHSGLLTFHTSVGRRFTVTRSRSNAADGNWHHVAATYSGSRLCIFLDGRIVMSRDRLALYTRGKLRLAGTDSDVQSSGLVFQGVMQRLFVAGVALSPEKLASIYREELPLVQDGVVRMGLKHLKTRGSSRAFLYTAEEAKGKPKPNVQGTSCSLDFCNAYASLRKRFCADKICSSRKHADLCFQFWNRVGSLEGWRRCGGTVPMDKVIGAFEGKPDTCAAILEDPVGQAFWEVTIPAAVQVASVQLDLDGRDVQNISVTTSTDATANVATCTTTGVSRWQVVASCPSPSNAEDTKLRFTSHTNAISAPSLPELRICEIRINVRPAMQACTRSSKEQTHGNCSRTAFCGRYKEGALDQPWKKVCIGPAMCHMAENVRACTYFYSRLPSLERNELYVSGVDPEHPAYRQITEKDFFGEADAGSSLNGEL